MAFGFKPVRYRDGTAYTGAAQRCYYGTAADLFVGDAVKLSAGAETTTGITQVELAGAGGGFWGIVVGMDPVRTDLSKNYMASGDTGYVMVCSDTNVVFQVTEDAAVDPIDLVDVGLNIDATIGSGNALFGTSGHSLNSDTHGTGVDVQFKLIGLAQIEGNFDNIGTADAVWEVTLNETTAAAPAVGT